MGNTLVWAPLKPAWDSGESDPRNSLCSFYAVVQPGIKIKLHKQKKALVS